MICFSQKPTPLSSNHVLWIIYKCFITRRLICRSVGWPQVVLRGYNHRCIFTNLTHFQCIKLWISLITAFEKNSVGLKALLRVGRCSKFLTHRVPSASSEGTSRCVFSTYIFHERSRRDRSTSIPVQVCVMLVSLWALIKLRTQHAVNYSLHQWQEMAS